ncbi:MAG: hypothetical protein WC841_05475 [Candidatus Shapirobacteria bacterium]|jgi:hypothetical protein
MVQVEIEDRREGVSVVVPRFSLGALSCYKDPTGQVRVELGEGVASVEIRKGCCGVLMDGTKPAGIVDFSRASESWQVHMNGDGGTRYSLKKGNEGFQLVRASDGKPIISGVDSDDVQGAIRVKLENIGAGIHVKRYFDDPVRLWVTRTE